MRRIFNATFHLWLGVFYLLLFIGVHVTGCGPAPFAKSRPSSGPSSTPAVILASSAPTSAKSAPASLSVVPTSSASAPASLLSSSSAPAASTSVTFSNKTGAPAVVNVAFGADSMVKSANWTFCAASSPLNCSFTLAPNSDRLVPGAGYLNATIAFNSPVGCGTTKAELNLNNPTWYDITDVSLVDGYSNRIQVTANGTVLGPPAGKEGNESILGIYPLGCDICTARQSPPCGIPAGGSGCKSGTQYNPTPPCQYQGPTKGGGGAIVVTLLP